MAKEAEALTPGYIYLHVHVHVHVHTTHACTCTYNTCMYMYMWLSCIGIALQPMCLCGVVECTIRTRTTTPYTEIALGSTGMLTHTCMSESGGPEQARQTADSCFELVGSHQCRVYTSCSGCTGFMYPKVSLLIVVSGIHPPQTAELHPRENPYLKNLMPQYTHVHVHVRVHVRVHVGTLDSATPWRSKCVERRVWHCIGCETAHSTDMEIN